MWTCQFAVGGDWNYHLQDEGRQWADASGRVTCLGQVHLRCLESQRTTGLEHDVGDDGGGDV